MTVADLDAIKVGVRSGIVWKTVSAVVLQLSRIVTGVLLARLLSPHDYGVAGMVLVISGLVPIFADLAFGAALIQRRQLTDEDKSTVFWTNIAGGAAFTAAGVLLAGPVADFYGEPSVKPLFAAFSVTFVVTAFSSTQSALLNRDMHFRTLELRQIVAYVAGAVVGIATAIHGGGSWAIILQQITIAVVSATLLIIVTPWRPRFVYSIASVRAMAGFSMRVFGTRLLFYVNRNIDNVLVGKFIGSAALGAYSLAYNVMLMPFSQIASPIQEVLFPAFSRLQEDHGRIAGAWIRVNRIVGAISIPSLVGLIIVAPDLVNVLLGSKWDSAIPVIQILCWVGLLQSLQRLNSSILTAVDRTQDLLRYSIIVCAASILAFVGGLHWGLVGVATGYAISSTIVEPYYTVITARSIQLSPLRLLATLRGVIEATIAMTVAVIGCRLALISQGASPAQRLLICILVGMGVYIPVCLWRSRALRAEIQALMPAIRRRRPTPAAQLLEP